MEDKVAYIKVDDLIKCVDESKEFSMIGFFLKKIIEAVQKVYLSNMEAIIMENNVIEIGGIVVNETDIKKAKKRIVEDVERIVNNPERQEAINAFHEKRQAKRQRKMLIDACVYAAIALAFGLLGCVSWMTPYIALPVCGIGGLCSAFRFGRWFENGKNNGWS